MSSITNFPAEIGDILELSHQKVKVVGCEDCDHVMVNIDADQLYPGDLTQLKRAGVRISNPKTTKDVCVKCEFETFGEKVSRWFEDDNDDDDDSSFFSSSSYSSTSNDDDDSSSSSGFGGFGGFGGSDSFGGFGGGSFSGGGAGRSF